MNFKIESYKDILTNNYDAILFLNGELPNKKEIISLKTEINKGLSTNKLKPDNRKAALIAIDGAANHLFEINLIPDIIIGDLDSYENKFNKTQVEVIQIENQEQSDLEKAFYYCQSKKYRKILMLGTMGGEVDHILNNFSIIKKFANTFELTLINDKNIGLVLKTNLYQFYSKKNQKISLIPLTKAILSTKGLKWELDNEVLEFGIREGARNISISEEFQINISEGNLILFVNF